MAGRECRRRGRAAAGGVLILSTEAVGVSRSLATQHHYTVDPNPELSAMGASNLLAGLSSGFVQSGGASQTAAADRAGGRSQLATLITAGLVLLTGAFLAGIFRDLPQATLAAIVIVAVTGFLRVGELRRFARLRRIALVLAVLAAAGVLGFGVLPGLVINAAISLALVIRRMSRPPVVVLGHDPLRLRVEGGLFYANSVAVKDHVLTLADGGPVELDLQASYDLDVQSLDTLAELDRALDLRLTNVHPRAAELLARAGLDHPPRARPAHPPAAETAGDGSAEAHKETGRSGT